MKVVAGLIGGLIFALLVYFVIGIASISNSAPRAYFLSFFVPWVIGIAIAVKAPTAAKAWRRLLLSSAVAAFCLPLAGLVFTGSHLASMGSQSGAETAGAIIGGTFVSGILGFAGFFLGAVFLIIGLLVGRDKQVVYVQAPQGVPPQG